MPDNEVPKSTMEPMYMGSKVRDEFCFEDFDDSLQFYHRFAFIVVQRSKIVLQAKKFWVKNVVWLLALAFKLSLKMTLCVSLIDLSLGPY